MLGRVEVDGERIRELASRWGELRNVDFVLARLLGSDDLGDCPRQDVCRGRLSRDDPYGESDVGIIRCVDEGKPDGRATRKFSISGVKATITVVNSLGDRPAICGWNLHYGTLGNELDRAGVRDLITRRS